MPDVSGSIEEVSRMGEAEDRVDGAPEGVEEEAAEGGTGGSLFRVFRRQRGVAPELTPADRKRRLAYAGGGVLAAAAAVLGLRWLRGRRG